MTARLLGHALAATLVVGAVLSGPLTERTAVTTTPPEPPPDEPKPKGDEPKEGDGAPLRRPYHAMTLTDA